MASGLADGVLALVRVNAGDALINCLMSCGSARNRCRTIRYPPDAGGRAWQVRGLCRNDYAGEQSRLSIPMYEPVSQQLMVLSDRDRADLVLDPIV